MPKITSKEEWDKCQNGPDLLSVAMRMAGSPGWPHRKAVISVLCDVVEPVLDCVRAGETRPAESLAAVRSWCVADASKVSLTDASSAAFCAAHTTDAGTFDGNVISDRAASVIYDTVYAAAAAACADSADFVACDAAWEADAAAAYNTAREVVETVEAFADAACDAAWEAAEAADATCYAAEAAAAISAYDSATCLKTQADLIKSRLIIGEFGA